MNYNSFVGNVVFASNFEADHFVRDVDFARPALNGYAAQVACVAKWQCLFLDRISIKHTFRGYILDKLPVWRVEIRKSMNLIRGSFEMTTSSAAVRKDVANCMDVESMGAICKAIISGGKIAGETNSILGLFDIDDALNTAVSLLIAESLFLTRIMPWPARKSHW